MRSSGIRLTWRTVDLALWFLVFAALITTMVIQQFRYNIALGRWRQGPGLPECEEALDIDLCYSEYMRDRLLHKPGDAESRILLVTCLLWSMFLPMLFFGAT